MSAVKVTIIALAIALILPVSCSVREDRSVCPCWLELFCKHCPDRGMTFMTETADGYGTRRYLNQADFNPSATVTVSRSTHRWCSWAGISGGNVMGGNYIIEIGQECDSIYSWHGGKDCRFETQTDTIALHKQFCTVYLTLSNPSGGDYPFDIEIQGDACGLNLFTGSPIDGPLRFRPTVNANHCSFRLPRQNSGSGLSIAFYQEDELLSLADLGQAMLGNGYDWEEADLKDLRLDLDYSRLLNFIIVEDWENGLTWDTEI